MSSDQALRAKLRQALAIYFNLEELHTLCFDQGIEHEDFPDRHSGFARELVAHFERRNRIPALVRIARDARPEIADASAR